MQALGFLARQPGHGGGQTHRLFFSRRRERLEGDIDIGLFRQFGKTAVGDAVAQQDSHQWFQEGEQGSGESLLDGVWHELGY